MLSKAAQKHASKQKIEQTKLSCELLSFCQDIGWWPKDECKTNVDAWPNGNRTAKGPNLNKITELVKDLTAS